MSRAILSLLLLVATFATSAPAFADGWECVSDGKSVCYVSYVRFFPNTNPYVRAEIYDPDTDEDLRSAFGLTSAISPTAPAMTAALACAPLIPPRPDET